MRSGVGLVAAAILAVTTAKAADVSVPAPEPVYVAEPTLVTVDIAATYFDMEVANGLGSSIDDGPFVFIRQAEGGHDIGAWGLTGDVTAWVPADPAHDLHGADYVIGGVEGAWVDDGFSALINPAPGEFLDVLPVNGAPSPGAITGSPLPAVLVSDAEYYRLAGFAGLGSALEAHENARIGLGAYLAYGKTDLGVSAVNNPLPQFFFNLDERVETWSTGPMVVAEARHELAPGVSALFEGRAAALYSGGDFNARQSFVTGAPFTPFTTVTAADSSDDFAGLAEFETGLEFSHDDWLTLAVTGGVAWRNDVYKIVNPRSGPGLDANNPASYAPAPARIEQTDLLTYSVGLGLTVAF